jgi:tRNA(fMet)-specific endonuclease VapC
MRWMLDTDTCIYVMKHHPPHVRERLRRAAVGEVGISAIVLAELKLGIAKSKRRVDNIAALQDFIAHCIVLDWPQDAAETYADIRAALEARGTPIGGNDLLIAAHSLHLGSTLVTNNTAEFERIATLKLENWRAQ